MSAFVFAQITRISACKVAKPAFMRFLALMQRTNVSLELCVRGGGISATIAYVGPLSSVYTLMIVFCLAGSERLVTTVVATGIWTISSVAKQVPR